MDVNGSVAKAEVSSRTLRIVVVEDEVLVRLMLSDALREEDFQVFEAADAEEAISILESMADVDVVVSDMRMRATEDGLSLARYVRARFPGVPVVLASAYPAVRLEPTFDAIFVKPFNPKEIATWIRRRFGIAESRSV
jgi:CheY-like chemotaxis protein